jgi:hypothetical protein
MAPSRFKPDGVLLGAGTNRNGWVVRAWDKVDRELVAIKHSPFDQDSANEVAILGLARHESECHERGAGHAAEGRCPCMKTRQKRPACTQTSFASRPRTPMATLRKSPILHWSWS